MAAELVVELGRTSRVDEQPRTWECNGRDGCLAGP